MTKTKEFMKSLISVLPGPLAIAAWDTIWSAKSPQFRAQRRLQHDLMRRIGSPTHVLGGPFEGMRYIERATGSAYLPKLVGTYEMEMAPAIESIVASDPDLLVDVGAAEGYYAVGMARRLPALRVLAYDIYKPARYMLRDLARRNGVQDRIELRERCTPALLEADLRGAQRPVIICDCEGYEDDLLQPGAESQLTRATLLVELHEMFRPGVGKNLRHRFGPTHLIQVLRTAPRDSSMLPAGVNVTREEANELMNERRSEAMEWLFMTPLRGNGQPPLTTQ
jgi:hypothetical protein